LAMIPILWDDKLTPFPSQRIDTAEAKQEEIKNRVRLVGGVLRVVFNHKLFSKHCVDIVDECTTLSKSISPSLLMNYYYGTMTSTEGEASSVSSKCYLIGPMPRNPSLMYVRINPLALLTILTQLGNVVSGFNYKTAYAFEEFINVFLCMGDKIDGVKLPDRKRVNANSEADTSKLIRALTGEENQLVVAHTAYPGLDSATSLYDWFNAKVGLKADVDSGAFVKLMTELGLASIVGDELKWTGEEGKKVTLTFVRNTPSKDFKCKFTQSKAKHSKKMDFKKLKAFYNKHVVVVSRDASDWERCRKDVVSITELYDTYQALIQSNEG
jgi:hypothetical protein